MTPEAPWPPAEKPAPRSTPATRVEPPGATQRPGSASAQEPPGEPAPGAPGPSGAGTAQGEKPLVERVIEVLKTCFDPEIPLNIYDLSLIYGIDADAEGNVSIQMTLTSPTCPVAGTLPGEVQQKVAGLPGVKSAHVALVWDPPWEPSRLSEAARLTLGLP
jgi:FeS assembly SUF system protein